MKRAKKTRPVFWHPRYDCIKSSAIREYAKANAGKRVIEWRRPQL